MKKTFIGVVVLILILVGGYFLFKHKPQQSETLQKITISQAYQVFLYAPLYIAEDKGFFKDQGLDVTLVTAGGDDKAFASLVSGGAQLAVGDPTFTAVAGEKGQPGIVVGAILNGVPFWGITNNAKIQTIAKPADLGSNKVATFPAPSTAYALQTAMFQSAGLKPNIVQGAPGTLAATVEKGGANIALELEPNVSTAVQQNGFHVVYSLSQYYPDFAITGLTALPAYVQSNPETIQKVVNAIQQADNFIRSNPDAAAALLAKDFPDVSTDVAVSALKNIVAANVIPANLVTSENGWNAAIKLREATGDIKKGAPFATYVNNSFAQNAK